MLPIERQNAIVELVNSEGSALVKELAKRFEVTEDCIRKDLTALERKGLLQKSRGGAVPARLVAHEPYVAERKDKNLKAKQAIAERAFDLINDGDVIFLDISTANIQLARLIAERNKRVTLVTNCIEVILAANVPCNIKLIALGGEVSEQADGFVGALTNEQLTKYRFDIAFIGVVGVDLDKNRVSTYVPSDGATKAQAVASSVRSYMMLESRKLQEDTTYTYAQVSDFTGAILEKEPEVKTLKAMNKYSLEWLY